MLHVAKCVAVQHGVLQTAVSAVHNESLKIQIEAAVGGDKNCVSTLNPRKEMP